MICIWRGIYLYAVTCFMTLRFTILSSFLSTQNPRIDKKLHAKHFYALWFFTVLFKYSIIYSCYSFSHTLILQIIYYITTCISNATIHFIIQFMRFKHIHKIPFSTRQCWFFHFDYSIHIYDGFRLMNPAIIIIR